MPKLPPEPNWLRADGLGVPVGVDRDAGIIRGYAVAQRGPFKTPGRGEFDEDGLRAIVAQMNARPAGLKSRFAHPGLSSDGIGTFLGRARSARLDGNTVRADLHLDPSSRSTPSGDLGGYVMDLAQNDPEAFGSSLVLQAEKKLRLDAKGQRLKDEQGEDLPPLWYPRKLHASDVVDDGDAVHDGFLAAGLDADELPDAALWQGGLILDRLFAGQPREAIEARTLAWLGRYLDRRFGLAATPSDVLRRRLDLREKT